MDEEKELESQLSNIKAFKEVFETEKGKLVLDYLRKIGHVHTSTINASDSFDLSHWREGRRSIVIDIENLLKIDIGKFKKRFKEQQQSEDKWLNHF